MFNRSKKGPKIEKDNVIIDSSMGHVSTLDQGINYKQLLELTKLLKNKFDLKNKVSIRLKKNNPEKIHIIFDDTGDGKHENLRPLNHLKTYESFFYKEVGHQLNRSIACLDKLQCNDIIENLKLMADPLERETEQISPSCRLINNIFLKS